VTDSQILNWLMSVSPSQAARFLRNARKVQTLTSGTFTTQEILSRLAEQDRYRRENNIAVRAVR
jgi:hypothetical protein